MKKIIRHITISFLIASILISSMGFSVNTLYCYCTGQYEASLTPIEHHCSQIQEDADLSNMHPCCKKAYLAACCKTEKKHSEKDCTKRSKKFFKADLKFLEIKKTELLELMAIIVKKPIFHDYAFTHYAIHNPQPTIPTRPPPQYFGRFLLNFIQVYRC